MKNRFDLEDEFMKCWHITDDIEVLSDMIADTEMQPEDMDKLLNCVIGIKTLYNYRFQKTFELVEDLIREGNLK